MKNLSFKILIFLSFIFFTGCGDDDITPVNITSLLTESSWDFFSIQGRLNPAEPWGDLPITNGSITISSDPCQHDDITTFSIGGTYSKDEGATKCSQQSPQTITGTWELLDNDTKLLVVVDNDSQEFTLVKLDKNTLEYEFQIANIFFRTAFSR